MEQISLVLPQWGNWNFGIEKTWAQVGNRCCWCHAPSPLGSPEFTCDCDGEFQDADCFYFLFSWIHVRTFTGDLRIFSVAQKCRKVKISEDNPQPVGMREGGWRPSLLILWWDSSEACSTWFLRGSPERLRVSLTQPILDFPFLSHFPYLLTLVSEDQFSKKLFAPKSLSWDLIWEEPNLRHCPHCALNWYQDSEEVILFSGSKFLDLSNETVGLKGEFSYL